MSRTGALSPQLSFGCVSACDGPLRRVTDLSAQWFRASSPYIRAHRGRTFVVMLGADALAAGSLPNIVQDLALLHVLDVRLVLIHGAEAVADEPLGPVPPPKLAAIEASAARARSRLEALFAVGVPPSPLRNRHVPLLGGNLVRAQPVGVVRGVDQQAAGHIRHIHAATIHALLQAGNVVALPPIGYSAGTAYAIEPEALAARMAADLNADKLILYDAASRIVDRSDLTTRELTALRAKADATLPSASRLDALLAACRSGVPRAHLIGFREEGALLRELFSAEGVGTQVSDGDYRVVRRATAEDVDAIAALIRPLEESGALVRRSRARLAGDIEHFFVAELDGAPTGCCALLPLDADAAELACLVGGGAAGTRLLEAAETAARRDGRRRLFALTTQAQDWFAEQGFHPTNAASLPVGRKALYNYERNAKVLTKELSA